MVLIVVAAIGLSVPAVTWRWFGLLTTLVHELGHASVAVLTGRRVTDIHLRQNHSGSVISSGYGRVSAVISGFFGYPAPALVGTALLWLTFHGWAAPVLLGTAGLVGFSILFIRNVFGWLVVGVTAGAAGAAYAWAPAPVQDHLLFIVGVALLIGSVRDLITVVSVHIRYRDRLDTSDAYILFRHTFIPSPVWLLAFAAVIGGSVVAAGLAYTATL